MGGQKEEKNERKRKARRRGSAATAVEIKLNTMIDELSQENFLELETGKPPP